MLGGDIGVAIAGEGELDSRPIHPKCGSLPIFQIT
jgi:hypothetical protein